MKEKYDDRNKKVDLWGRNTEYLIRSTFYLIINQFHVFCLEFSQVCMFFHDNRSKIVPESMHSQINRVVHCRKPAQKTLIKILIILRKVVPYKIRREVYDKHLILKALTMVDSLSLVPVTVPI